LFGPAHVLPVGRDKQNRIYSSAILFLVPEEIYLSLKAMREIKFAGEQAREASHHETGPLRGRKDQFIILVTYISAFFRPIVQSLDDLN
jgi:hypothetical protein